MKSKRKVLLIVMSTLIVGCYNDKGDQLYPSLPGNTCDTTAVSYQRDIVPILSSNCNLNSGCHNAQSTAGYNFTTYAGVQLVATHNLIVDDINGTPTAQHNAMPLNLPKISQCDINMITAWVNQGALNN